MAGLYAHERRVTAGSERMKEQLDVQMLICVRCLSVVALQHMFRQSQDAVSFGHVHAGPRQQVRIMRANPGHCAHSEQHKLPDIDS